MGFLTSLFTGPQAATNQFQAQQAPTQTSSYGNSVAQAQQNALGTTAQQNALAQMLTGQAAGGGPNPALDQLKQTTQANAQQAAGAIASQKGINPELGARLINEQQANLNQQAAGQAATQAAQQQLGSENLLGNVLANQQSGNLGLLTGAGGLQNQQNSNAISNNQGTNQINQATAAQNAGFQQQANQSAFGAASGLLGGLANAAGGFAGLGGFGGGGGGGVTNAMSAGMDPDQYSNGGLVHPALMAAMKAKGGRVPGKAQTAGNSPRNDTVPALLSPGEIVVPRTVAHDPVAAKEFVRAIIEHRKGKGQAAGSKR